MPKAKTQKPTPEPLVYPDDSDGSIDVHRFLTAGHKQLAAWPFAGGLKLVNGKGETVWLIMKVATEGKHA